MEACEKQPNIVFIDKDDGVQRVQYSDSIDELTNLAENIEPVFLAFLKELSEIVEGDFKLGPKKKLGTAEEKINRDYEGKAQLLCDIVRGKVIINSPKAIEQLREILSTHSKKPHEIFTKYGAYCALMSDYFSAPKDETGYRCINARIAFPVKSNDENAKTRYYIVELQGVHKNIESVYIDNTNTV